MTYQPKIRQLIIEPNPLLRKMSQPIVEITEEIQNLIDDMIATMYHNDGVGLAGIQVGVALRLFVMDTEKEIITFINPEIVEKSLDSVIFCEGCLSLPTIKAEVTRHKTVTVKFIARDYTIHTRTFNGLSSICIQHEVDHLNGVIFLDYLSKLKRDIYMKKLYKLQKTIS
jgi:peptide deformylase